MNKYVFLLFITITGVNSVFARLPKTVPLLPPRESGGVANNIKSKTINSREVKKDLMTAGVEIGTLMRSDSTSSDLLGMQLFVGGRVSLNIPVMFSSFYLTPSIGYFRKNQSEGSVAVVQNVFEGGIKAQYRFVDRNNFNWSLGVANRFDYLFSQIKVYNQSSGGQSFRYRVGPSSGLQFKVSNNLKFTTDLEFTVPVTSPMRLFGGLTTGLAFDL
jgi:hypothetical protein